MIGGSPIPIQPTYLPRMSAPQYAAPRPASVSPRPLTAMAVPQPTPPPRAVRAQMEEVPARSAPAARAPFPLRMPSPEELGLVQSVPAATASGDWTAAHRRLQAVGATGLLLDPLSGGGWRVSFALPAGNANQVHRIQAQAATPEAAVQLALTRADEWLAQARR